MTQTKLDLDLARLVDQYGLDAVRRALPRTGEEQVLSIISDGGMHRKPSDLLLGEVFIFSDGMIPSETDDEVQKHIISRCRVLASKLREKSWTEVRLFFSGHALLGAYAKLTVYRVSHLDTVDFGFFGDSGFRMLRTSLRKHLLIDGDDE